jgi:formiminoglutamase
MRARLPVVISVPHGGLHVPDEARPGFLPGPLDLARDGDTWARELYALEDRALGYLDTRIPRAVVDVNRAADDRPPANPDGVVKTVTVQGTQVWRDAAGPDPGLADQLVERYHAPFHAALERLARKEGAVLALDCHTMLATGPAIGPDPGKARPLACLGHRGGATAPDGLVEALREALVRALDPVDGRVTIDDPFSGGYITRTHGGSGALPWVQLELSRALYLPDGNVARPRPDADDARKLGDLRGKILRALGSVL